MEALARAGNVAEALLTFDRLRDDAARGARRAAGARAHRVARAAPGRDARRPGAGAARRRARVPLPGILRRNDERRFVSREPELRRLQAGWEQARDGRGALVLVTGEPGIGKSRLAARFAAGVHAGGAFVTHGRAEEDTVVPYQPFVEALRHLIAHVDLLALDASFGPLLEELGPLLGAIGTRRPRTEDGRYALFEAAATLLERVAQLRPLLLVLEDLHWADKPTLLLLRQIVRHTEAAPIMVLATYNDLDLAAAAPLQRVVADLRRDQTLERILLTGLDVAATAQLAGRDVDAARLREYTSGNPFFIEETLRADERLPDSLRDVLVHRFERLAPTTLELLTLAAVLGRDFSLEVLQHLAGRPLDAVLTGLEEAEEAGLIVEDAKRRRAVLVPPRAGARRGLRAPGREPAPPAAPARRRGARARRRHRRPARASVLPRLARHAPPATRSRPASSPRGRTRSRTPPITSSGRSRSLPRTTTTCAWRRGWRWAPSAGRAASRAPATRITPRRRSPSAAVTRRRSSPPRSAPAAASTRPDAPTPPTSSSSRPRWRPSSRSASASGPGCSAGSRRRSVTPRPAARAGQRGRGAPRPHVR